MKCMAGSVRLARSMESRGGYVSSRFWDIPNLILEYSVLSVSYCVIKLCLVESLLSVCFAPRLEHNKDIQEVPRFIYFNLARSIEHGSRIVSNMCPFLIFKNGSHEIIRGGKGYLYRS